FKEALGSTLSGLELWFDEASGRLNKDKRGWHVGKFDGDDQILSITKSGNYKITNYELTTRFEPENKTLVIEKFHPKKVISAVYWDGESKQHFVKRFQIETTTPDKEFNFITEGIGSRLEFVTTSDNPEIEIELVKGKGKDKETEIVNLEDLIDVKGWKALGNRLSQYKVTKVKPVEEPEDTGLEEGDDENEMMTIETEKGSQSSKKKYSSAEEGEQASLFEAQVEQQNQNQPLVNGQPPKPKAPKPKEPEQANLFGEKRKSEIATTKTSEGEKEKSKVKSFAKASEDKREDEGFSPGQTIELEL